MASETKNADSSTILETVDASMHFGGLKAVDGVSLQVPKGSITGLIGPNGAGKTTLFNVMAGALRPTGGTVRLENEDITDVPAWARVKRGLARTFQTPHGFPEITVYENLMVAPLEQEGEGLLGSLLWPRAARKREAEQRDLVLELLERLGMAQYSDTLVCNLAAGDARVVEFARQVMLRPRLLLLDEPAAGINPAITGSLIQLLRDLRSDGLTLLVIDHNLSFMMELCDSIYVLAAGKVIAHGSPAEIARNPKVIEAYLGRSRASVENQGGAE